MILLPVRERYKEVLNTMFNTLIGGIYSIIVIPLFIIILPFMWCDKVAALSANLLCLDIYDD